MGNRKSGERCEEEEGVYIPKYKQDVLDYKMKAWNKETIEENLVAGTQGTHNWYQ